MPSLPCGGDVEAYTRLYTCLLYTSIMELADILVVTKDDGDNRQRAAAHCQELKLSLIHI